EDVPAESVFEMVESWNVHNRLSVPVTEYPAVFIVTPSGDELGFAIQKKRQWTVTMQIEFYFDEYEDEQDEEVGMWWIEEISRLIRLNPTIGQPNPTKIKVMDWTHDSYAVDYFTDGSQLLMGVVCSTTIKLLDCRGGTP
ncbi:MAG: hypothetical protein KAJ19_11030, partial [Gammaproteobacteria bacterium]|nr:hypothetical protein [Gammaproteobacteria bacterium]